MDRVLNFAGWVDDLQYAKAQDQQATSEIWVWKLASLEPQKKNANVFNGIQESLRLPWHPRVHIRDIQTTTGSLETLLKHSPNHRQVWGNLS